MYRYTGGMNISGVITTLVADCGVQVGFLVVLLHATISQGYVNIRVCTARKLN